MNSSLPSNMLNHSAPANVHGSTPSDHRAGVRKGQAFEMAASVLAEMQQHGIPPMPSDYELWFTFRSGTNPRLSACIAALIQVGTTFTSDLLASLKDEFFAGTNADTLRDVTEDLQDATEAIVVQVAAGNEAMRGYGATLEVCSIKLGEAAAIDSLLQAVTTLTAETTKAAERNQILQQQLAASVTRVTKLRQAMVDLKQEATTDGLTGLLNRKAFDSRLRRGIAKSKAEPDAGPLSLLLFDIDHFKRFNDTYGHKAGDLVLRLVGRVLADSVKGRDTAARYGGEEFVVVLLGADLRAATIVAEQISAALSGKSLGRRQTGDSLGRITVSVGVAQYRSGDSPGSLLERADMALYRAKQAGRNRVCIESDGVAVAT